jgi:lipopolysaccharide/colanic/teichoic acid biosynthesis glycosyltransferase
LAENGERTEGTESRGTSERSKRPACALGVKRLLDVLAAAGALIPLSPLLVLIAIAVKLTSRGPAVFSQLRCGRGGKPFRMFKFRTMVAGAEELKADVLDLNEMTGPAFKAGRDPRVTSLGRFLRRFSLDELPQFWNVLKGDMSLVGPRPLPVEEAAACTGEQSRRHEMRPGLACLWQVRGRSEITDFDEWARLDLEYVDNWSLWLDVKILLGAIPAVLTGRGAR